MHAMERNLTSELRGVSVRAQCDDAEDIKLQELISVVEKYR